MGSSPGSGVLGTFTDRAERGEAWVRRDATAGPWLLRWAVTREPAPSLVRRGAVDHAETGAGSFAALDGYLFLTGEHGGDPARASAVLTTYEAAGDGLFGRLRGGFLLAIWDAREERLVLARDPTGLHACYYAWTGRLFLASSSLYAILRDPALSGRPDRIVLAEHLRNWPSADQVHETFYEGVRRLPPATTLTVRRGGLSSSRYWHPVPLGFSWATPDEAQRVPATLGRAVSRCLSAGADSISLSGGFDSVSLAALAAGQRGGAPPLRAVCMHYTEPGCDEAGTQRAVARALGMPQLLQTLDESLPADAFLEVLMELSRVSPCPLTGIWQPFYAGLLRSAARLGLNRLIIGDGGDDLFNTHPSHGADCLARLDLGGLWRLYRAWQRTAAVSTLHVARVVFWDHALWPVSRRLGRAGLERVAPRGLRWVRQRGFRRHLEPWLPGEDPELVQALERRHLDAPPVERAPGEGAYAVSLRQAWTRAPLQLRELDRSFAFASHLGFTFLYPFLDRDVVELALRVHPEELITGGRQKAMLRRLVAERLPAVPMQSRKVGFRTAMDTVIRSRARGVWRELGGPVALGELGLVKPSPVNRLMEDYFAGRRGDFSLAWRLVSAEAWLRARSERIAGAATSLDKERKDS